MAGEAVTMILVVTVILLLVAIGVAYSLAQDIATFRAEIQDSNAAATRAEERREAANAAHQELANTIGYRDEAIVTSKSDVAAIESDVGRAKSMVGASLGGPDAEPTVDETLSALMNALTAARQQASAAQADLESEIQKRQAAENQANSIENSYRSQISALNQQLSDAQARYDSLAADTQRTIDSLQADNDDLDVRVRALQRELADAQLAAKRSLDQAEATIASLALRPLELEPEAPDGEVLEVGDRGEVAYIDIGGRDGLRRGTRFELLRRGKGGELVPRGMVEVREVDADMAMVGLVGEPDPFDPMLPGDLVRNPHFQRGSMQHFVLLGEFPGALSKDFVARRLEELGGAVDDRVSTSTDVLVLGYENLALADEAEPLSQSDEYLLADRLGVRMVRLDELAGFLRY